MFSDRPRRPLSSPSRCPAAVEAAVLEVRDRHPAWGARKIAAVLARQGVAVPAASTVHAILLRQGRIEPPRGGPAAQLRFERAVPNELWQMDFKGHSRLGDGQRLHPLTVIDDHSRYALCLSACPDETGATVRARLEGVFRRHGLPLAFFVDNGNPWGDSQGTGWTRFGVWLAKLGIRLIHARPYHPQSRGKNERFHRSLEAEVLALRPPRDLAEAERAFARWRDLYNHERPHEGIGFDRPADRYRPSPRPWPRILPEPEYAPGETVLAVPARVAALRFQGRTWFVPKAFRGERLALRPHDTDGEYGIYFGANLIRTIDFSTPKSVNHVSEHLSAMSPG